MPEDHDDGNDREGAQDVARIAERLEHVLVAAAEAVPEGTQRRAPDGAADGGEEAELAERHLPETGGEGHEGAQQGNEAAEEDDGLTPPGEPGVGPVQVSVGQEQVLAEPVDERPTAVAADGVARQRAEELAQDREDDDESQG